MRVEHPDTKGAGDCEAGTPPGRNSRAAPAGSALSCVANGRLRHMLDRRPKPAAWVLAPIPPGRALCKGDAVACPAGDK